jgi:hypothetical protein
MPLLPNPPGYDHDKPIPGPKGSRILQVEGGHAEFSTLTVSDAAYEFLMRRGINKNARCAPKKAVQKC